MTTKRKYRLYALNTNKENMAQAREERFSRITLDYILVYTNKKRKNCPEITDKNISALTEGDKQWLLDCNMAIIASEIDKDRDNFVKEMEVKLSKLEKALMKEKDLIKHEQEESDNRIEQR